MFNKVMNIMKSGMYNKFQMQQDVSACKRFLISQNWNKVDSEGKCTWKYLTHNKDD